MKKALIFQDQIVQIASESFPVSPEMAWHDCDDSATMDTHYFDGVSVVVKPPRPLDEVKAEKRAQINAARDAEEATGFDYLGKRFDSDAQAIKRLYGAAMAAQAAIAGGAPPTDVMVTWTTADGTTIDLTYQQAAAVPVAMAQVAGALHAKARTLKAQVDAATTVEQVEAIAW